LSFGMRALEQLSDDDPIAPSIPKVIQKLRSRSDARDEQMILRSCTSDVQKVAFGVVHLFKVRVIADCQAPRSTGVAAHLLLTPRHAGSAGAGDSRIGGTR
jgi:hypothetical protein